MYAKTVIKSGVPPLRPFIKLRYESPPAVLEIIKSNVSALLPTAPYNIYIMAHDIFRDSMRCLTY